MSDLSFDGSDQLTVGNLRLRMEAEQELEIFDPRDDTNLGTMVCSHKRYDLGDKGPSLADYREIIDRVWSEDGGTVAAVASWLKAFEGATVVLPLYLIDHSGLSMRAGRSFADVDPGEWDSGLVGFIFDTPIGREVTGVRHVDIEASLRSEVEEYDRWLQGDVWTYVLERLERCDHGDIHARVLDSCGGFIGHEYAEQEALAALEAQLKEDKS
jgi:hypothetical protein